MIQPILQEPHPDLHLIAREVTFPAEREAALTVARDLVDTLDAHRGLGLSAPQIGVGMRIIVVKAKSAFLSTVIVNPRIKNRFNLRLLSEEGCLSIGGGNRRLTIRNKRYADVVITGLDLDGEPTIVSASGTKAIALQHEIDHLDGITLLTHRKG